MVVFRLLQLKFLKTFGRLQLGRSENQAPEGKLTTTHWGKVVEKEGGPDSNSNSGPPLLQCALRHHLDQKVCLSNARMAAALFGLGHLCHLLPWTLSSATGWSSSSSSSWFNQSSVFVTPWFSLHCSWKLTKVVERRSSSSPTAGPSLKFFPFLFWEGGAIF